MYVHAIEGSWWLHPFWRRRFLIEDERALELARDGGAEMFVIDTDRGGAPVAEVEVDAGAPASAPVQKRPPPARRIESEEERQARELERAAALVQESRAAVTRMFKEARLGKAVRPADVGPVVEQIAEQVFNDASALIRVTRLKRKNEYTYMHSVAVCALMINLGRKLRLPEETIREIGMAGLLHDIGKMSVPDAVLMKPGALSDQEFAVMRDHPVLGHDLLKADSEMSAIALDVCLHHHERVDGNGYPFGLTAEQLSIHARMGAVCDVYDAVTSNRCYKSAWTPGDALNRMKDWDGHFDPGVLDAFIASIGIYPTGTLVRMRTNRLGVVLGTLDRSTDRPLVRCFFAITDRELTRLDDVEASSTLRGDGIVGVEMGEAWFGSRWSRMLGMILANQRPIIADDTALKTAC
ncbi:putative nucleotidyltransferase with HDIG domain [Sphingomonas jejuensis]|uniref:Nucleotidyltransferase with HDIG domain n=2 Tax=Sphingomonas jejuensis TaxID=904715 RepID=A0ABX0XI35_9SPHN|nr:putative nucleotidyltransferase with HDIG domain [Sphingomonas jejuensis]